MELGKKNFQKKNARWKTIIQWLIYEMFGTIHLRIALGNECLKI